MITATIIIGFGILYAISVSLYHVEKREEEKELTTFRVDIDKIYELAQKLKNYERQKENDSSKV